MSCKSGARRIPLDRTSSYFDELESSIAIEHVPLLDYVVGLTTGLNRVTG